MKENQKKKSGGIKKLFSSKKRTALFGGVLAVVILAVSMMQSGVAVEVMAVKPEHIKDSFTEDGTVCMGDNIDIISNVAGKVQSVLVKEGEYVEAGQVIAVIDSGDYEDEIRAHQSKINSYEAQGQVSVSTENYTKKDIQNSIEQLKVQKEELKNNFNQIEIDYNNYKTLFEGGSVSRNEFDQAQKAYDNALLALQKIDVQVQGLETRLSNDYSSSSVKQANAGIEAERVMIENLQKKVEDCNIKASTEGYISELPIKDLSMINPGQSVATMKSEDKMTVEVSVLTSHEPYLKVGGSVKLTQKLKGEDVVYDGTIEEIYDFAAESISSLGLKEYRVDVVVVPQGDIERLKSGYEMTAEFAIYDEENQLAVPIGATFSVDDVDYVFKADGKTAVRTPVHIAYKTNTRAVIDSGLAEGDKVIMDANIEGLTDQARIAYK